MTDEHSPRESADERAALLKAAYAVKSPDDNRELYSKWAATYEEFLETYRYIYARQVAEMFVERSSTHTEPVLDAGCGTGRVGLELSRLGVSPVDGIDISPEMLDKARAMSGPGGVPSYRRLMEADLTGPIALETGSYSGVVSSGAFTHGHLGPDALSELLRVARPGAVCIIGVNTSIFESNGFKGRFERYASDGVIDDLEVQLRHVYEEIDADNANHLAHIATFTRGALR
ncbi:MAG: class I SAM-dependent methyltransferase [Acidimicrobiaceae bacterium]|nr:class I SAM-dependent methyltransferase [Acidimicrobiaceae bacterium]MYB28675.1 class I SAM-dependent methyltransferase [Acidimicrobiaceae bacterium]